MRYISVLDGYSGKRTGGAIIHPGVYTDDDPALFGCADLLIERGLAVEGARDDLPPAPVQKTPDGMRSYQLAGDEKYYGLGLPAIGDNAPAPAVQEAPPPAPVATQDAPTPTPRVRKPAPTPRQTKSAPGRKGARG